jgi:hypothetical protein
MPRGLERFRDHFAGHTDKYVLIGGTACELALSQADLTFRATKDLDIVLTVATLDVDFSKRFWEFVEAGKYQHRKKLGEKEVTQCYRFKEPATEDFPAMLELFARKSDALQSPAGGEIGRVEADAAAASLSAILMDDAYYSLVTAGRQVVGNLSSLRAEQIIPLKARAFLDLSARQAAGGLEKSSDIKKHKNDVFRLYALLTEASRFDLPPSVKNDFAAFLVEMRKDPPDLKALGVRADSAEGVINQLARIYQL